MRKSKIIVFLAAISLLFTTTVYAKTYKCVGMDSEGKKVNVLFDEASGTINVNGKVLNIVAPTKGKNGAATEDYELEDGTKAYVSLVVEGDDKIMIRQMSSDDDKELSAVELACD